MGCYDGAWSDDTSGVAERLASPLLWHGAPVWPAIDALVRAMNRKNGTRLTAAHEAEINEPVIWWLAHEAAAVLGGEVVEVPHA